MTAKEFLNQLKDEYETCNRIYSPYHIEAMEQYANKRVIKELEMQVNYYPDSLKKILTPRINQLKAKLKQ